MVVYRLEYPLADGYIHNWLVAGPKVAEVLDLSALQGEDRKALIARQHYSPDVALSETPAERESVVVDGAEVTFRYYRCLEDHLVELSCFCQAWCYLRAWTYAELVLPTAQEVTLVLTTHGPADLWISGQHVHRQEHFHQDRRSVAFSAAMAEGRNEVLVRLEQVAARECPYAMALRVLAPVLVGERSDEAGTPRVRVTIPTRTEFVVRRQMLERVFEQAHLDRHTYHMGNRILLRWAEDLEARFRYVCQVQDADELGYVEAAPEAEPSKVLDIGHPARLWERDFDVVLRPTPQDWYERNTRYERRMPVRVLDTAYSEELYGTLEERRKEALEYAAKRGSGVYAEIAKMALGRWPEVVQSRVMEAITGVNQRRANSDRAMMGLLGMMYRYMDNEGFPQELKGPLEECVLGFRFWLDEPGSDAMCFDTESHSILFHACEVLAGQRYANSAFASAGQMGHWHREKGEKLALAWLHARGTSGFSEWDSNDGFAEIVVALSHLSDLAQDASVRELAAVVMDKLLLTVALNSYRGVFGSTHGRTNAEMVKGGQSEATSGITRLMWAMGVWNRHIEGVVSLACSAYELPLVIPDIAVNLRDELWNREHHPGVDKVTYRTPDYMLCSAQDYHSGEEGSRQHIWQATMGPDAVVFVNHPSCMSEEGAHRASMWAGNAVLPRVAQWRDVLIAVHRLPENDWMGFTHAYFPVYAFDEHVLRGGWAFARKGRAYLALTAARGLELVRHGPGAYHELRSYGRDHVWLCHMGRIATDGEFGEFQRKVLALDVAWEELGVRCQTLRGDTLAFGWEGPLVVNGSEQQITGFRHYDNPYCVAESPAVQMEVRSAEYALRLDFSS